jgi:hypothetical protein
MSDEQEPLDLRRRSAQGKIITDKLNRLCRIFIRDAITLIYAEIGVRSISRGRKRGPKPGYKVPPRPCPMCGQNPNSYRRVNFICKPCRGNRNIGYRENVADIIDKSHVSKRKKDPLSDENFKVELMIPNLPVAPEDVDVPTDEQLNEATFLDIVEAEVLPKKPKRDEDDGSDEGFFA